jgi:Mn2+/Fe2+ NRAMP family transporter
VDGPPPRHHRFHVHRFRRRRRPVPAHFSVAALAIVAGPGLLAGLSDDDPAGITTYSILGARFGYRMLWVLALSTVALIVFHELGARMGCVTGKGLATLVRQRFGHRASMTALAALVVANVGTCCAEFAGVAAGLGLAGVSRYVSVPLAALVVSVLVLRSSFHRIEHVLLLLSAIFATYVVSGVLAHPHWGSAARGLVVPSMPLTRTAVLTAVATVGTTLAPWGLAFIQSYAVDKRLSPKDLRYERIDVVTGAVLTGVIGLFVVVACAATIHARGGTDIHNASDAAVALRPLAGHLASALFGAGLVGAALLAAAVLPLSTAYSVAESFGKDAKLDDRLREAPLFYGAYAGVVLVAVILVLLPGAPLIPILFLSQALNAVLLLAILPFMVALARDRELMGAHALTRSGTVVTSVALALIATSVVALGVLAVR